MVRVKYIPTDDGREIAFFPDSEYLFFVREIDKQIFEDLSNGAGKDDILRKYPISADEFEMYLKAVTPLPPFEPPRDPNGKRIHHKVALHLANGCNLHCVYCYANGGLYHSDRDLMTKEVLDRTVETFYREFDHIEKVQFFGGEPLLNMDVMEYACEKIQAIERSRGFETSFSVVTNGTLINERFIELVKKYGIVVTVSYDGDPAINDRMRVFPDGSPTSEIIFQKIKMLREAKAGPRGMQAAYTQYHADAGITPLDMARHMNSLAPDVLVQVVTAAGTPDCPYVPKDCAAAYPAAIREFIKEASQTDDRIVPLPLAMIEVMDSIETLRMRPPMDNLCDACHRTLAVSTKGDIYPCYTLMDRKEIWLGNVFEENVFHTDHYQEAAREFMKHNLKSAHEECKDCFISRLCARCMAHDDLMTGKLYELDHNECELQRAMYIEAIKGLTRVYKKETEK